MAYERLWAYTYIFREVNIFDYKSDLGAILDYIILTCFVIDSLCQFSVDSQWKWLNISENADLGDI